MPVYTGMTPARMCRADFSWTFILLSKSLHDGRTVAPERAPMKLYVTLTSPYARLARIVVVEKGLEDRVEIVEAKTRTAGSPYYRINPSGRVPYLVDDAGVGMEDSQLICAYLDGLDGKPRFITRLVIRIGPTAGSRPRPQPVRRHLGVGARDGTGPRASARRPPLLTRSRAASAWRMSSRPQVADPLMQGPLNMAQLVLAVALDTARVRGPGDLTAGPAAARRLAGPHLRPALDARDGNPMKGRD